MRPETIDLPPPAGDDAGELVGARMLADRLHQRVAALQGRRAAVAALASGAFSVLAMAPFFLWPVLFFTLPVLVWLIDGATRRRMPESSSRFPRLQRLMPALAVGWWWGFGYFLLGTFWIGEAFLVEAEVFAWLLPFAVTLLPAGLALFPAVACAAASEFWRPRYGRVLLLAIMFGIAEWLRGHVLTGLPWNVLGYALTWPLVLMQGAGLIGIYGLTVCAVVIFAGPLVCFADHVRSPRRWLSLGGLVVSFLLLACLTTYGAWRLAGFASGVVEGVKLRVVQPSVPQRDKWRRDKQREIFLTHLDLSRRNAAGAVDDLAGVTHVIWPEAAMPFLPLNTPEALSAIGELLGPSTKLLTGALRVDQQIGAYAPGERAGHRFFNSLMVFGAAGQLVALYDKIHLVPFGEYLPMQGFLESLGLQQLTRIRGGFDIGVEPRPLLGIEGLPPVLGLICYEAIFPAVVVQGVDRPGVIVNVTNDGWFGNTTGPRQHLQQTRVRAVEEGVPIIRAANNGISAIIDGQGRLTGELGLNVRGVFDGSLPRPVAPPPYARFGDLMFMLTLAVVASVLLRSGRNFL